MFALSMWFITAIMRQNKTIHYQNCGVFWNKLNRVELGWIVERLRTFGLGKLLAV